MSTERAAVVSAARLNSGPPPQSLLSQPAYVAPARRPSPQRVRRSWARTGLGTSLLRLCRALARGRAESPELVVGSVMSVQDAGDGQTFAQLDGAYWLNDAGGGCVRCQALFGAGGDELPEPVAAVSHLEGGLALSRVVILPVAVLTVTAALLVAVFG